MGYFSWKTADTKKSIVLGELKTVYMLQPNGGEPIEERMYEGYGEFGGVDAYEWLAIQNLPKVLLEKAEKLIEINSNYELRTIGIYIDDAYCFDKKTKKSYCIDELTAKVFDLETFETYSSIIRDNKTVNQLIAEKEMRRIPIYNLLGGFRCPLKFSYNKNAIYEDLKASKDCD